MVGLANRQDFQAPRRDRVRRCCSLEGMRRFVAEIDWEQTVTADERINVSPTVPGALIPGSRILCPRLTS